MKIVDLTVTSDAYDAIINQTRDELYCHAPHSELVKSKLLGGPLATNTTFDAIRLLRGTTFRETTVVKLVRMHYGYGKKEWGAPLYETLIYKIRHLNKKEEAIVNLQKIANELAHQRSRRKYRPLGDI